MRLRHPSQVFIAKIHLKNSSQIRISGAGADAADKLSYPANESQAAKHKRQNRFGVQPMIQKVSERRAKCDGAHH